MTTHKPGRTNSQPAISELAAAIRALTAEKDLPRDALVAAVEDALAQTYRRQYGTVPEARVAMEVETGQLRVLAMKTVVIDVRDERTQISLRDAQFLADPGGLGDIVEVDITPEDFGRVGAQSAKQAILQRIHEAERDVVYNEYMGRAGELMTGTIQRIESRGVIMDLGRAEGVLPPAEQIARERYRVGQRLRTYCVEVTRGTRMPTITLSRTHKNLLKRLFELEVPEIFSGNVEIKAIAREAGSRSKVAVMARMEGVDPIGACVGPRGTRIQTVVNELSNEKIDVIVFDSDPARFVANALSPADVRNVTIDLPAKTASVTVLDDMLSLAIGKEGQNARLAAKLTGWRIDIKGAETLAATTVDMTSAVEEPVAALGVEGGA